MRKKNEEKAKIGYAAALKLEIMRFFYSLMAQWVTPRVFHKTRVYVSDEGNVWSGCKKETVIVPVSVRFQQL